MKKIFVGNLAPQVREGDIRQLFEAFGEVGSVELIYDSGTDHMRGFGFVEMDDDEAFTAIGSLNGQMFEGRLLRVKEARPPSGGHGSPHDRW